MKLCRNCGNEVKHLHKSTLCAACASSQKRTKKCPKCDTLIRPSSFQCKSCTVIQLRQVKTQCINCDGPISIGSQSGRCVDCALEAAKPRITNFFPYRRVVEEPIELLCKHHWMIDSPNGPTSNGVCKKCGDTRDDFHNSIEGRDYSLTVSEKRVSEKR